MSEHEATIHDDLSKARKTPMPPVLTPQPVTDDSMSTASGTLQEQDG